MELGLTEYCTKNMGEAMKGLVQRDVKSDM